jgi:hypothetical protein
MRARLPISRRNSASATSSSIAARHCAGDAAKRPFDPSSTQSRYSPVGVATHGIPHAAYSIPFNADFPSLNRFLSNGTKPISIVAVVNAKSMFRNATRAVVTRCPAGTAR